MKKINQYLKSVVVATFATLWSAAALGDGDIYEFHPTGDCPCNTALTADSIRAGDTVEFTLRLVNHNYTQSATGDQLRWEIYCKNNSMSADEQKLMWSQEPLCLGIVVNGRTEYAEISLPSVNPSYPQVSEMKCTYTVKYGDFAMPIRLAADAWGKPVDPGYNTIGFKPAENSRYFFATKTGNTNLWGIRAIDKFGSPAHDADGNLIELEPYRWSEVIDFGVEGYNSRNGCYDLINFDGQDTGYYVKTIDFDPDQEHQADVDYWRVVHEDTTTVDGAYEPYLELTGMAPEQTRGQKLYVWSDNEKAVFPTASADVTVSSTSIKFPGEANPRVVKVAEISLKPGATRLPFKLKGAPAGEGSGEGQVATLYLSAKKDFTYLDSSGLLLEDFRTVRVKCGAPLPSSMRITATDAQVTADEYYKISKTTLTVAPNGDPYDGGAYTVKVVPSLTVDGAEAEEWKKYVRISTSDQPSAWTGMDEIKFKFEPGERAAKVVYVFVLGGDDRTTGLNFIKFEPVIDQSVDPGAYAFYAAGDGFQSAQISATAKEPVVTSPEDKSKLSKEITAKIPFSQSVKITDAYANYLTARSTTTGYKIDYKTTDDSEWTSAGEGYTFELESPGDVVTGYLKKNGADPVFTLTEDGLGKKLQIRVTSPGGKPSSSDYFVEVDIQPTATIVCTVNHGDRAYDEYNDLNDEQGIVHVKVESMSRANKEKQIIYAFLKPLDEDTARRVTGNNIAKPGNLSDMKILQDGTTSDEGTFQIADGPNPAKTLAFDIVLCKSQTYDETKLVDGYQGSLTITAANILPQVWQIDIGGLVVTENGSALPAPLPKGVAREIIVTAADATLDLDDKSGTVTTEDTVVGTVHTLKNPEGYSFFTEVKITEGVLVTTYRYYGDPSRTPISHKFNTSGTATIEVQMRDKDMKATQQRDTSFKFTLEVSTQPMVVLTVPSEIDENAIDLGDDPTLHVGLTEPATMAEKVTVGIKLEPTDTANPGILKLAAREHVRTPDEDWDFEVDFSEGMMSADIPFSDLDGTLGSLKGWTIEARVVTSAINPVTGLPWSDYYVQASSRTKVKNVEPMLVYSLPTPEYTATNAISAAIGAGDPITWSISDILPDFEKGITVQWWTTDGGNEPVVTVTDPDYSGNFVPMFKSDGPKIVKCTVKDSKLDGGMMIYEWHYQVTPSKVLKILAAGPSGGYSSSVLGQHYAGAAGLGEGHVWASGFSYAERFELTFLCGTDKDADALAFGYKVGAVDDGSLNMQDGTMYSADIPLSPSGNNKTDGKSSLPEYYTYPDKARDSFLYVWLLDAGGNDNAQVGFLGALSPETEKLSQMKVGLPVQSDEDTRYPETILEAVFSKEMYAADNCGDINQDGIPDLYLRKYGLGVYDSLSGKISDSVDDLISLAAYNKDGELGAEGEGDFLPAALNVAQSVLTGKPADLVPFKAIWEIRGYGNGLNDAPALAGVQNVKPERHYTDPALDSPDEPTKASTLSYVEYLAWCEYAKANDWEPADETKWSKWSPERPTDPTLSDTDGDGLDDGFEYFFWYRAHVGYLDANGIHRHLTGRRYNPRNPGEGTFISHEEIAATMDPITPADVSVFQLDSDNDGLPDVLEYYLGTNPFDFDSDGDGLPDGWELCVAGTDPLNPQTTPGVSDALRNYDGDAMAFTTPKLEGAVLPKPFKIEPITTFALVDANGDTDGVQWYATKTAPTNFKLTEKGTATSFKIGATTYLTLDDVKVTDSGLLAKDLTKEKTWMAVESSDKAVAALGLTPEAPYIALMPVHITVGTPVSGAASTTYATVELGEDIKEINTAWQYGMNAQVMTLDGEDGNAANLSGFGMLAIGRYSTAKANVPLAALPKVDENVAYLHYLVYQEFGFDARTAWNATTPLAARWGSTDGDEDVKVESYNKRRTGYAGVSTRTRKYTTYDEFLLYSFFVNNGMTVTTATALGDNVPALIGVWMANTTNPQGPNEPNIDKDKDVTVGEGDDKVEAKWVGRNSDNGADTDGDGVPDGWELYVMAGPKNDKGKFVFGMPYGDGAHSSMSPFSPSASEASYTDNSATKAGDGDGLTELREFSGTDSSGYYASLYPEDYSDDKKTILPREKQKNSDIYTSDDSKWLNKFFPTDPWNKDTDGDGLTDGNEIKNAGGFNAKNFLYGDPVDNGKLFVIPGGGLNPCSVDTDKDGLPDAWEAQFAGTPDSIYKGEDATYASSDAGPGNPLQGLTDGMDGTVFDAYNYAHVDRTEVNRAADGAAGLTKKTQVVLLRDYGDVAQVVDRDYDHDGLENWQEYLVGAMRCWRYDDPKSPWSFMPYRMYFDENDQFAPNYEALGIDTSAEDGGEAEFWYRTLFDKESPIYNPHLVTDTSAGSQYFTQVKNGFDLTYTDAGTFYIFYHRLGDLPLEKAWDDMVPPPTKYISCSPLKADTDQDGMDDYYELFHGMNPLLGGVASTSASREPCDIVFESYSLPVWHALNNPWTQKLNPRTNDPKNNLYDFEQFPWLNGLPTADPDGDDIRNQDEAIMPMVAPASVWQHTDPTPLWMTDSSYTNSLVYRFFRIPVRGHYLRLPGDGKTLVYDGETYDLTTCDSFCFRDEGLEKDVPELAPFSYDQWGVALATVKNWFVSFEENEGYDTDHDGISDTEELQTIFKGQTDPQDHDSPRRRQAMYFPGENAALQTMPFVKEQHPRFGYTYPDDMSFLQYTAECWVKPETTEDSTVIERAIWSDYSNGGDQEFLRKNFQIAIRDSHWYTKFDSNGTLSNSCVEIMSPISVVTGEWTHVAATYDGKMLKFHVNGVLVGQKGISSAGLQPEYGSSAVVVNPAEANSRTNFLYTGRGNDYWFDREYSLHAILIGASFRAQQDGEKDGRHLNVLENRGWSHYKDFFKGYIDEVRIWDGARTTDDILTDLKVRYTAELAAKNRQDFYDQWSNISTNLYPAGRRRYAKDINGNDCEVIPELRFHWSFDSLLGAENKEQANKCPHGFHYDGDKMPYSRPEGYRISWWRDVLKAYSGTVYNDPAYVFFIPNTVTHLPRFDGTTLDSMYWSKDYAGNEYGTYNYKNAAEPVSRWTQYFRNSTGGSTALGETTQFVTTSRRFWLTNTTGDEESELYLRYEFAGRHLNQQGDDLLALGGAFVKYVDTMWDDNGPSDTQEITGEDTDNNGLPDWWEDVAKDYKIEEGPLTWNTLVNYNGQIITAGEAYLRDIARGFYVDKDGNAVTDGTTYQSRADLDKDGIPDWWEEMFGIQTWSQADATADPDNDGLSNYYEYLASMGDDPYGTKNGFPDLNPLNPRTTDGQKVIDYFLQVTNATPDGLHLLADSSSLFSYHYMGEIFTDHDMMEDWWEDDYANGTSSSHVHDPWDDTDQDGWSNFAECRSWLWNGGDQVYGLSRWTSDAESGEKLVSPITLYPQPAIVMTLNYKGGRTDLAQKPIVVRTRKTVEKVDATFRVPTALEEEKVKYIGTALATEKVHGFLSPGNVAASAVFFERAIADTEATYNWTWEWYDQHQKPHPQTKSGSFLEYFNYLYYYPRIKLVNLTLDWEQVTIPRANATETETVLVSKINQNRILGKVNAITGEFEFDLPTYLAYDASKDPKGLASVYRISYASRLPYEWPKRITLSDTQELLDADGSKGLGHVKEGLNEIEAWIDINADGKFDPDTEPYGFVKKVYVGWHKVPSVTLDLIDPTVAPITRVSLTAASGGGSPDDQEEEAVSIKRISVVRTHINGQEVKLRQLLARSINLDDRGYITEADMMSTTAPDIDWRYLTYDAAKVGITVDQIESATYSVQCVDDQADDQSQPVVIKTFKRSFDAARPKATAVSPAADAPVCSASPKFEFTLGAGATAFAIQIREAGGQLIYESGALPAATSFVPPVYVDTPIGTSGGAVMEDHKTYQWRVTALNAKYCSMADETDWSDWAEFKVEVNPLTGSDERFKNKGTGFGRVDTAIRYFGPLLNRAEKEGIDLASRTVVEAFENADFSGEPMAQARVSSTKLYPSATDITTANAHLGGLTVGTVYLRAYIDWNDNGKWDKFEPWGYANQLGSSVHTAIFQPVGVEILSNIANLMYPSTVVIYIEDTDYNKNGVPDCLPEEDDKLPRDTIETEPAIDLYDWWSWANAYEDERDSAVEGDVMAYAETEAILVGIGEEKGDVIGYYLLDVNQEEPQRGDPVADDKNAGVKYLLAYEYPLTNDLYIAGDEAKFVSATLEVKSVQKVKRAYLHNQVYQAFDYDCHTANSSNYLNGTAINTKPFTVFDKKLLVRYLQAMGRIDPADLALDVNGTYRYFDEFLDALALTKPEKASELWDKYSLKAGDPDGNGDGIPDGWQLYTMFGPSGQVAKATPWTSSGMTRHTTEGGELTYKAEWDRGDYPTDPWQLSTFKDPYTTDEGTFIISDKDAYAYHLKGPHKYEDADNDGLINYEEYVEQFNGGYALSPDRMTTFFGSSTYSALTGQVVPDYFLKALQTPKYYLGFKHTSHDFIESWWKDSYSWSSLMALNKEPRKFFMPYDDPDGDGWDNWSEARAGTDPTQVSASAIDDYTINQFPTPIVNLTVTMAEFASSDSAIVVKAYPTVGGSSAPDATWVIGDKAGGEAEKFIGFNPGVQRTYNLGGAIVPGTFTLEIKDLTADSETWDTNKTHKISSMKIDRSEAIWSYILVDTKIDDGASWGYVVYRGDGNSILGTIDYATGDLLIDFAGLNAIFNGQPWRTWTGDTECIASYPWKSYIRMTWTTKATSASFAREQHLTLSDATNGRLRQGYTKFIAFADNNGNGEYDPGEPFGMASDVDVGWDRVTDLKIALATTTPVLPRFDPKALDKAAKLDDGSDGLSNAVAQVIAGKPVIVDVTPDTYVRVVRWTINDEECKHRVILSKKLGAFEAVTEADVLSKTVFDLDWKHLEKDAHDSFFALNEIDKIVYAVFVGDVARTEENVNGWIVKKFAHNRANATPVAPTAADTAIVNATRPEFEFKVPEGYPSYAFKLINATGKVVFCSTNLVTAKNAAGHVVYQPPVYFGAEAEDLVNHLLPTGRYSWSVAMLNAKFRETKDGWCTAAEFDVQMAKGKVHDTDKGILEVAVRYYGEAEISTEHPIIVQAFRSADFTGVPDAQAVITDKAGVFCIYDDTNTVNVAMYGLVPGDYYVRAFIDTTKDVVRSTWESWGYQNNVGTGRADLYTPISTKVERNVISSALVFIEDMDTDNDGKPDCLQPFKPDDGHPHDDDEDIDSDGDGLTDDEEEEIGTDPYDWDTDGDGMPDGWEEWADTDPLTPDADYVVPDDVMAYEEVEMWLITLEDGTQLLLKDGETVPKPGDTLANYGEAFYVPYWYGAPGGDGIYGRGQPTAAPTGAMVNGDGDNNPRKVPVALVHDQVYDEFGFDPNTAVPGGTIHTKDFTALDKYLLLRYREMMGSNYWADGFDPSVLEGDDYDDIEDYVNQKKLWPDWTLKPGYPDNDAQPTNPENGEAGVGDGIGDGWELFTHHNPWNYFDRNTDDDGDGVTLLDEYDYDPETGKAHPTDPRNIDTDGDGVTDDLYHKYLLHDPAGDKDGDGLSNYAEYLITEVFKYDNLDPRNPTTDGHCVDYFRKLGDLYLGEIFTDHDQVGDDWEGVYNDVANRYIYNPDLDIDEDGWSNYAEFRADTNPRDTGKLGVTDSTGVTYVHPEYPVPVIEAKVVYNGHGVNLENVVFKAWSEKSDPDMTSAPDAIWTLPTIASDDSHVLVGSHKYLDLKPVGEQRYLLYGGDAAKGSIQIKVLNRYYTHVGIATTNDASSATNNVQVSKVGDPNQASWYLAARDVNGAIITLDNRVIGSVDYGTGVMVIDFSALSGPTVGDPSSGAAFADSETLTDGGHDYDLFSLDDAVVLLNWSAVKVGVNPAGIYFLGEADGITKTSEASSGGKSSGGANRHHGWVREGRNTFICFVDTDGDGNYSAGELYGFARGVDVGWQGAKFEVELTESSPVFARVNINDGSNDRVYYWGADSGDVDYTQVKSNDTQVAAEALSGGIYNHVRIVPYAVCGTKQDTGLYHRDFVAAVMMVTNRVVAEFDVNSVDKPYITEADFIKNGKFDIDWDLFDTSEFAQNSDVRKAVGDVTAVKYRIVLGKEGPVGPIGNLDTTTVVRAFSTLIERRYEPVASRTLPTGLKLKENILFASQPTFMWRLDESTAVDGYAASAALYGCSYTAFEIQIEEIDKSGVSKGLVYDSGVQRVPVRNREGYFVWTAPLSAGDQTALGKIFSRAGNYRWKVAMYNAKFHPGSVSNILSNDGWSEWDTFSTDVGMQQVIDDHNYSAIGVCVKYTGPEKVLENCADTTTTKGMVRIQAFTTADFSGEPVSQAFITDKASLVDTTDVTVNGMLYGLPVEGTFYIRAYIDSNGNFTKDDWESWGYAKTSVTLTPDLRAQQNVGVYIEDADTDQDWLPDAWEYETYGDLEHENTYVDPEGKIVLKTQTYQVVRSGKANISTKLPGASLTLFQNLDAARMLLGMGDYTEDTLTAIRAAIEKNVVAKTLKITSLVVDTDKKKVVMTVNGEVDDSIAGQILSPVYILPESSTVTLRLYKKNSLVEKEWTKVKDYEVTVSTTLKTTVEVPMPDVDFSAGFYKIEVVR